MSKTAPVPGDRPGTAKPVFNELSPASIAFSLALSGQTGPDIAGAFTYADLGTGVGLSAAGWAAQYPDARFFSFRADPACADWTRTLADKAGLGNFTALSSSPQTWGEADLPLFDFIVLPGTYSHGSARDEADLKAFVESRLKPQGVVCVGYGALPGQAVAGPLRHIVREGRKATGEKNAAVALGQGLAFLKELQDAGALFFRSCDAAGVWLDGWRTAPAAGLMDEFFEGEDRAFAFTEILERMQAAGVSFVGSLDLTNYLEPIITPPAFMKRLEQVGASLPLRETVKDLLYNTVYRRDLYIKAPRPLAADAARTDLGRVRVVLSGSRTDLPDQVVLKGVQVTLKREVYAPIVEKLTGGPSSIADLADATGQDFTQVAQAAVVMAVLGWVQVTPPSAGPTITERIKTFNRILDEMLADEPFPYLLTVNGGWQHCGFLERLYGLARLTQTDPGSFIRDAVKTRRFQVNRDGQPVTDAGEIEALLKEQIGLLDDALPPVLVRLGLVD